LYASAFALLAALTANAALAQTDTTTPGSWWSKPVVDPAPPSSSAREILLGTITTGKSEKRERLSVADQLLADGLEALHRGDVMLGRRRLEAVIDAYPDSPAAVSAREELSVLYNIRARTTPGAGSAEPTARLLPTQNTPEVDHEGGDVRNVRGVAPDDRSTFSKEARARERQNRRDERWLRALSFDFQMAAGDRVFFAESSVEIGARARSVLAAQARWLTRHPSLPVVIEAHADDSRGNRDFDTQISEKRARAVQERLVEEGIEPSRISIVAFGRDRPVATCDAPECAAQNRRVITRIGNQQATDSGRRGVEEPALAIVPPHAPPVRRD
jgi:peptidoglycan-associated lipoprotein